MNMRGNTRRIGNAATRINDLHQRVSALFFGARHRLSSARSIANGVVQRLDSNYHRISPMGREANAGSVISERPRSQFFFMAIDT